MQRLSAAVSSDAAPGARKRPRPASPGPSAFYSAVLGNSGEEPALATAGQLLSWWFDGDGALLSKDRWFCRAGTDAQRHCDAVAQQDFAGILQEAELGALDHWRDQPYRALALVVLLDQISRHVYRDQRGDPETERHLVALSVRAAAVAKVARERGDFGHLRPRERVFMLMPLRHVSNAAVAEVFPAEGFDTLDHVLAAVRDLDAEALEEAAVVERFRRATTRRRQDALLQGKLGPGTPAPDAEAAEGVAEGANAASAPLSSAEEDLILEHVAADRRDQEAAMRNAVVVRTMEAFLNPRAAGTVLVSLSGGVDSMVIARVLAYMRDHPRNQLAIRRVVALHIWYGNREESALEARYLAQFCAGHDIEFRQLAMPEDLRRASATISREDYEEKTRELRFDFYRRNLEEFGAAPTAEGPGGVALAPEGIMLGHHRGDVEENVLSNALKGAGVLALRGMEEESVAHQTRVWRPYLGIEKKHILAFAHDFGVPYFRDTTPLWSTRGKIRTQLLPLLHDIYGRGVGRNLALLAEESHEYKDFFDTSLLRPALETIEANRLGLMVPIARGAHGDLRSQGVLFWRALLRQMLHSLSIGALRESSVRELLQRLRRDADSKTPAWLELRKDLLTFVGDGNLYLLRPDFAYLGVLEVTEALAPKLQHRRPHQFQPWGEHGASVPVDLRAAEDSTGGDGAARRQRGSDPGRSEAAPASEEEFAAGPWRIRAAVQGTAGRCPAGATTLQRRDWPPVEADLGGVPDLFAKVREDHRALITYDLVVGRAALEAAGGMLRLDTVVPDKADRFADTSAWRAANRKLAQLIPRVELPELSVEASAGLPESDLLRVRVDYRFVGDAVSVLGLEAPP